MRIALISQYFYPEQFSNNAIAHELVCRGHEVHAFPCVPNYPSGRFPSGYSNKERREDEWEGVRISRVFTVARGERSFTLFLNYITYPLAACWTIFRKLEQRADVSFVSLTSPLFQAFPAIVLRWRTGTPCVYWVQDIWPESVTYTLGIRNRLIVALLNAVCGWLYRRADLVMVQSAAFHDMITRFGVPPQRIRLLPNTAPDNYRPVTPDKASKYAQLVPQDGFRLMFAGNIGESQDFDTLIATAELLRERRELHWVIIGSGRDEKRVRRLVQQKDLAERFYFLGRHPEEEMPYFFAHADAMLVSLKDIPIFALTVPYKTQCYMACGKPIVASLNGEGAEIIRKAGAGVAVAASQPHALAEAIATLIDAAPDQLNNYAANARRYFEENYSTQKVYDDLEKALTDVIVPASE